MTLAGTAVAPGIAQGHAFRFSPAAPATTPCAQRGSPEEQFEEARRRAEAELRETLDVLPDGAGRQIVRAHLALLRDPMLIAEVQSHIHGDLLDTAEAIRRSSATLSARFEGLAIPVLRQRAADVRDVFDCIARQLAGTTWTGGQERRVICAGDLSPAQVLQLASSRPVAFVLEHGAVTSHAAILLRALGVPVVIGVGGATAEIRDGDLVVVDGEAGTVAIGVPPDAVASSGIVPLSEADCDPAVTRDGVAVAVTATIADASDARRGISAGADGVGLFRTEWLFLTQDPLPSEDFQHDVYSAVFETVGPRPLTVRLADLGADKQAPGLALRPEPNPALGLRGVRFLLTHPELVRTQVRALVRAAGDRTLRVLVPMVVDPGELARIRDLINATVTDASRIELGVMLETPAAALMARELAAAADFLSIGTNDLAQYVLAVDRENLQVAALHQPLHPAVLRLVRVATEAATRQGKRVCVCGEAAGDARAIGVFLGMGVSELSVASSIVPRVKAQVRRISAAAARTLADELAGLPGAAEVLARIGAASPLETGIDVREARHAG